MATSNSLPLEDDSNFMPGRKDELHLRVHHIPIYVRNQDRSLASIWNSLASSSLASSKFPVAQELGDRRPCDTGEDAERKNANGRRFHYGRDRQHILGCGYCGPMFCTATHNESVTFHSRAK